MGLEFYLSTSGSDNNGGSSESVIVSGSSALVTQSDATIDLSGDTPDLSGVNQGSFHDTIRIAGRTDGINGTDVFDIIAVESAGADTVEVSPTPTDANQSGLTWAIGGPWATPQKAMAVVDPGDRVWMKADGDYTDDTDADGVCCKIITAGTSGSPIKLEGYKSTIGDADTHLHDDAYRAVINGTAESLTNGISVDGGLGMYVFWMIKNILAKNCGGVGIHLDSSTIITVSNCRSTNNSTGFSSDSQYNSFAHCEGDNNDGSGFYGGAKLFNCRWHHNEGTGVVATNQIHMTHSLVYKNDAHGFEDSWGDAHYLANNTFVGKSKVADQRAIQVSYAYPSVIANNIFHDWDIGLKATAQEGGRWIIEHNLFSDVNTKYTNVDEGASDIEGAVKFVDEANDDYRLRFGSPARGAGLPPHVDIGARQRKELPTHGPTNVGVQV